MTTQEQLKKEFFDPTEAAIYLGMAPATLARWRSEKAHLPYCKIGGTVRYKKADLDTYAESTRVQVS